ncbi:Protein RMD5-like protein A [Oopsacas minuta]|uniref:Protein RMD5-like protein A n=1 Tax=Oopsacas minuta TaxID=111878 RepID=A0AAV7JHB0_9METZ|nr:Protein RMD5-like protein A [Oopsacas minuta]
MDSYQNHIREMDKIQKNYTAFLNLLKRNFNLMTSSLTQIQSNLFVYGNGISDHIDSFSSLQLLVKESTTVISSEHRNIHPSVSKIGKVVEKHFVQDVSDLLSLGFLQTNAKFISLSEAIQHYLLRHGFKDSLQFMSFETGVFPEKEQVELYIFVFSFLLNPELFYNVYNH